MKNIRLSIIALLLIILKLTLNISVAQDHYAIFIKKEDGLPSNEIYDALQDDDGNMWMATSVGLIRYDGRNFKTFKNESIQYLPGSSITADKQNRIWYMNFDGNLYFAHNDELHTLYLKKVNSYMPYGVSPKHLLYPQKNGLDVYDINYLQFKKHLPLTDMHLYSAMQGDGNYYVITGKTIYKIDDNLNIKTISNSQINGKNYTKGFYDKEHIFLINEFNNKIHLSIYNKDLNYIQSIPIADEVKITNCNIIDDHYYISTYKGIYVYNKEGKLIQHLYKDKSVAKVIKDKQKNLWIFFSRSGLAIIPKNADKFYELKNIDGKYIIPRNEGLNVIDINGNIYNSNYNQFGDFKLTYNNPVFAAIDNYFFDKNSNTYFLNSMGGKIIKGNPPVAIKSYQAAVKDVVTLDQKYWAIAMNGAFAIIPNPNTYNESSSSVWDYLYATSEKSATSDIGRLFNIKLRAHTLSYNAARKKIYGSSNLGLYVFTPSSYTEILNNGYNFYAQKIITVKENSYALTNQGSFYEINDKDSLINWSKLLDIEQNIINQIKAIDDKIYILTEKNMLSFDINTKSLKYVPLPCPTYEIRDFTIVDNNLLLLTAKGIIEREIFAPIPHDEVKFRIHSISVNNIKVPQEAYGNIKLPKDFNELHINYAYPIFNKVAESTISYRINEDNWIAIKSNSDIELYVLPEGKSTISFKVNDEIQDIKITVFNPIPIYKQIWFWILIACILVAIIIAIYRWRIGILRTRITQLEEKVILEKELGRSIVKSVKAQMNPHFFFNALNTIQAFVYTNDKDNAGKYLNKFSKLTRRILDQSELDAITLKEEIETIWLYVELENMRYNNTILTKINIAPELDVDQIKIPSMLIQPFIENAFKHGLFHKIDGVKQLTIDFKLKDQNLHVTIDDNGIGRAKAEEINKAMKNKHKSFATDANLKRIEIINKHIEEQISIKIKDKYTYQGLADGTCVTLIIPIIK